MCVGWSERDQQAYIVSNISWHVTTLTATMSPFLSIIGRDIARCEAGARLDTHTTRSRMDTSIRANNFLIGLALLTRNAHLQIEQLQRAFSTIFAIYSLIT